ncbi:hypothetical protein AF72_08140 [Xylella taiwanensis]|uniref:Uncharacterized protein n=1 Tax=Xylella taiwanensis TaxID=1444770 RepID=Z9JIF5_9GAMM|nr:hypothetical protein AB672_04110 [Xylella taiwanensis]EWS77959.1 hypothetical protein AF72_08140 [Xylella taiwanensis]
MGKHLSISAVTGCGLKHSFGRATCTVTDAIKTSRDLVVGYSKWSVNLIQQINGDTWKRLNVAENILRGSYNTLEVA